jgi:serine/threonine protein kinase
MADEVSSDGLFPGELPRGSLVAGYKVRQRVGGGATGSVYAGVHPQNGRKVAIKLLHPHLAQHLEVLRRFEEQSQRIAALHHPGIISMLEMGRLADGQVYLISDFALGQPLTDLLQSSGALEADAARPLIEALALVLATAHGHQVVHGGLTPDNIWITPQDSGQWPPMVRVMDFGMGLLRGGDDGQPRWLEEIPYYLSPEQCRGEPPQACSDIYALGVIVYQMLTGRLPFSSSMPSEVVRMHREEAPRPPSSLVRLAPGLDALLLRALAKDPAQRFQTMFQLLQTLRAEVSPEPAAPALAVEGAAASPAPSASPEPPGAEAPPPSIEPTSPEPRRDPTPVLTVDAELPASPALDHLDRRGDPISGVVPRTRPEVIVTPPAIEPHRPDPFAAAPSSPTLAATGAPEPGAITGVLPLLGHRRLGRLLSALLGLMLAGAAVVIGYQLLVGRFPWESSASHPEGTLRVTSQPAGAQVTLNNVTQPGRTPLIVRGLLRGQPYELSVSLPGHEAWKQVVALGLTEEERRLDVRLSDGPTRFGSLTLSASERVDFFLDDRKVATQVTQATLADVRAGVEHELRVIAPGFKPIRQKVRVEAGKSQVLQFTLERE